MIDTGRKVKLLDPKNDCVFKKIFGEKGDERYTNVFDKFYS